MSYWETLLVILRRWRLSVPAALLAMGVGAGAFFASPPLYEDTTQVLFIGSPIQPGEKARVNPYLGLGSALVQTAAVIQATISTPQVADTLYKQGATGVYLVAADLSTPAPVLLLTTKDADPAVARRTRDAVVEAMKQELLDVQRQAGAPVTQYVSTTIISALPEPQRKYNASIRPAITAGAGVFALAMFALFLLEGRRQRRSRPAEAAAPRAQGGPPVPQYQSPQYQAPQYQAAQHQAPQYQEDARYPEPAAQYDEPRARYEEPAARYEEPAARYPEPAQFQPPPARPVQPRPQPLRPAGPALRPAAQAGRPGAQQVLPTVPPLPPPPPGRPDAVRPVIAPAPALQPGNLVRPAADAAPGQPAGDTYQRRPAPGRQGPAGRTPPNGTALPRRAPAAGINWFDQLDEDARVSSDATRSNGQPNGNGAPQRDADGRPIRRP